MKERIVCVLRVVLALWEVINHRVLKEAIYVFQRGICVSFVALRFFLSQELSKNFSMTQECFLVVGSSVNELLAERLKELMIIYELSYPPGNLLKNLKAPDYSLLILATQNSLSWQLSVSLDRVYKQSVVVCKDLLLFDDKL